MRIMKRLVIIAEGDTEESFVNNILSPHFNSLGLYNDIQCFKIKKSSGGISKYSDVKKDIINTLYENDVIVSTMLDFYRLPSSFPGKQEAATLPTHLQQVEHIEEKVKEDVETAQECRFDNFIPYIQLHEFEALVFSSINGVDALFEPSEFIGRGHVSQSHAHQELYRDGGSAQARWGMESPCRAQSDSG